MLNEYLPLFILITLAACLGFLVVGIGHLFGPRRPTLKKSLPYESGMVPYGAGARRVNVRFYLVAVLFILFDLLVIFFMPWAVALETLGVTGLIGMGVFVAILLVGYVYAWKIGALEWE